MTYRFIVECADCGATLCVEPSQDAEAVAEAARVFITGHSDCPAQEGNGDS